MFNDPEKAILVGVETHIETTVSPEESLAELKRLTETAGAQMVGQLVQKRSAPHQRYYLGSGKLEELKALVTAQEANLIVFDVELSASQQRNLEAELNIKVIDRTELILDIFAQHAKTREGKLQVALAQSSFLLTRLAGHGASLSRLGGGIGTRGPGETKLEYDRRRIRDQIVDLQKELEKVRQERGLRRANRSKSQIPMVALVGYTNSGKSTLFNSLTKANLLAADKLFATLDPTIRRLTLSDRKTILLSDTVGFIQKLPHQLIAAFRSTLEEISSANLLLHVVDLSSNYFNDQITAVKQVLAELNCEDKQMLTVFNKTDKLGKDGLPKTLAQHAPYITISTLYQTGLTKLQEQISTILDQPQQPPPATL